MADVQIVLGSESDMKVAEQAKAMLDELGIRSEVSVASAHRAPEKLAALVRGSRAKVFIAVAGLSAALPGAIAARTPRPVIGVPVGVKLEGLDALLSSMQMPPGVPVATVGIDNGRNAALLAAEILALGNEGVARRLSAYRERLRKR